jgi:hypothetical protein
MYNSLAFLFKIICLKLKSLLFAYKDAFSITLSFVKDIFRIITKVFFIRNNVLKVMLFTLKTQEHFKTSILNLRYKLLT